MKWEIVCSIPVIFILGLTACATSSTSINSASAIPVVSQNSFQENNFNGVTISYPVTMTYQVTSTSIKFTDRAELFSILFQVFEDAASAKNPAWYPPSETLLRKTAYADFMNGGFQDTEANKAAYKTAANNGTIIKIAGYPAIDTNAYVQDTRLGMVYVRVGRLFTPARTMVLFCIGGQKDVSGYRGVTDTHVNVICQHIFDTLQTTR
jgi:hypothetical protein